MTYTTVELQALESGLGWTKLSPDQKADYLEAYHAAPKCAGCGKVQISAEDVPGARYCWYCGADAEDAFGKILATDLETVKPWPKVAGAQRSSKEQAKIARQVIKEIVGSTAGFSVRMTKGSSGHIRIELPNLHAWQTPGHAECGYRAETFGEVRRSCHYCDRRRAAGRHLEAILVRKMAETANRSDSMVDYFDFTWLVS